MSAQLIRFPKTMKRGPKMKRGPCAMVMHLPNNSAADLYARFMASRHRASDREEAYAEYLDHAERRGYTHGSIREAISNRREQLLCELDELDRL